MSGRRILAFLLLFLTGLAQAASAERTTWAVTPGAEGNEVVFHSRATMESFEGRTDRVSGEFMADLADLRGEVRVRIEVDLASLDTGIGLRNTHMRENHLETDRFPRAVFTADRIVSASAPALVRGETVRLELAGRLDLHGVVRELTPEVDLVLGDAGALEVSTAFTVKLSDHGIDRPRFLVLKLADEQEVSVRLRAVEAATGGER